MPSQFIDLKLTGGERLFINTTYISQITPTYGNDFADGADVAFLTFDESSLVEASVPASQVQQLLKIVLDPKSPFLDIKPVEAKRLILNQDYITHIFPTYGTNLADGASVSVWGTVVQVPASGVSALTKVIEGAA